MKLLILLIGYYLFDKFIQKPFSYQFLYFPHFFCYADLIEARLAIEKPNQKTA
jgi:hypothetical protein